jgi:DNA-binding MarR family transcriptional regulator
MKKRRNATDFDSSNYIPALLSTLNNRLSSGASDLYLKHFDVGINEWRILTVMAQYEECNAKFIAEQAAIHEAVISRSVRGMAEKGLVHIDSSSWQRTLSLTKEGTQKYLDIAEVALRREALLVTGLTADEQAQTRELLRKLTANIPLVNAYEPLDVASAARAKRSPRRKSQDDARPG